MCSRHQMLLPERSDSGSAWTKQGQKRRAGLNLELEWRWEHEPWPLAPPLPLVLVSQELVYSRFSPPSPQSSPLIPPAHEPTHSFCWRELVTRFFLRGWEMLSRTGHGILLNHSAPWWKTCFLTATTLSRHICITFQKVGNKEKILSKPCNVLRIGTVAGIRLFNSNTGS